MGLLTYCNGPTYRVQITLPLYRLKMWTVINLNFKNWLSCGSRHLNIALGHLDILIQCWSIVKPDYQPHAAYFHFIQWMQQIKKPQPGWLCVLRLQTGTVKERAWRECAFRLRSRIKFMAFENLFFFGWGLFGGECRGAGGEGGSEYTRLD